MQLILSDYIKLNHPESILIAQGIDVINWFNNHTFAAHILYAEQKTFVEYCDAVLTLIKACITRWTSHVMALLRLLKLKKPLRTAVYKHRDALREAAGKTADAKAKADVILATIESEAFWKRLAA